MSELEENSPEYEIRYAEILGDLKEFAEEVMGCSVNITEAKLEESLDEFEARLNRIKNKWEEGKQ